MRYVVRRLGFFVLTLWAALTFNFLLPRLMPGNPALAMLGKFHGNLTPQSLNALEILFGVNTHKSLPVQYVDYLHQVVTGNFGTSLDLYSASVTSVIGGAAPWTLGPPGPRRGDLVDARPDRGHPRAGVRPRRGARHRRPLAPGRGAGQPAAA